ncbi:MAG TPA: hypothetical protein VMS17_09055 [Gemmataceae bacterium]|nr:hypothetical protein [Gemmataceae bacterium]
MSLQFLKRRPPETEAAAPPVIQDAPTQPPAGAERSVLVQHGIHTGHFPVGGLRVREARQTLAGLLNIDPQAVAVINGQVVSEDTVINDTIKMLSFVKPSAVKGY